MPAKIRLKRVGRKKQSSFRIVVTERSEAVSGAPIEQLGIYKPRTEPSVIKLDAERALHWLRTGAKPSDTVRSLFQRAGLWEKFHAGTTPEELTEKEIFLGPEGAWKTSRRAETAAAAAATATEAPPEEAEEVEEAGGADEASEAGAETEGAPEAGAETEGVPEAEAEAEAPAAEEEVVEEEGEEEEEEVAGAEAEVEEAPEAEAEAEAPGAEEAAEEEDEDEEEEEKEG